MRASALYKLLKHSLQHGRRVLIRGKPGIGKSDIVGQVCVLIDADLIIMHPAICDPTDFKGMPVMSPDGKSAEFVPFGELKRMIDATKLTVVFLDDIGQAAPAVQAALMQLVLARRVNGHRISDHVVFVGATNDTSHCAAVSGMIEPLKSRWDTIVELEVSNEDWKQWALNNGMPVEVIAFVGFRPALLSEFKPTKELKNSPSPRGWGSVGGWMNDGIKDLEVFTGAVGEGAALEFCAFTKMCGQLPSLDGIIADPNNAPIPDQPGALFAVSSGLARKATPANFDSIMSYTKRLPKDFDVCCGLDAQRLTPAVVNTAGYIAWASRNGDVIS